MRKMKVFMIVSSMFLSAAQAKAEVVFSCKVNVEGAETLVTGYKWQGHGTHYSIEPYSIVLRGKEYVIQATFYTVDGTKVIGKSLSIGSEGFIASGNESVRLMTPGSNWPGVSVECKLAP